MKTIVWGNYKGGVGKTTSSFQVARHLSKKSKKILLLDLDPQASLSHICVTNFKSRKLHEFQVDETLNFILEMYLKYVNMNDFGFNILQNPNMNTEVLDMLSQTIQLFELDNNLHFIPTSISFQHSKISDLAQKISKNNNGVFIIKLLLNDLIALGNEYDYVFIDSPPTSNIITQSAFMSSDYYIIPTIIDEISANGVAHYITEIEKTRQQFESIEDIGGVIVQRVFSQKIKLIGVFETLYKDRRGDASNIGYIQILDNNIKDATYSIKKFESLISKEKFKELRYPSLEDDTITTNYIFKEYISHKDNRSGGESVAKNTSIGEITGTYKKISEHILTILENTEVN